MILQESLCSELWCGGSQEPRPPAPGGPAPPLSLCPALTGFQPTCEAVCVFPHNLHGPLSLALGDLSEIN